MRDPRQMFAAHRCQRKPDLVSIRRYGPAAKEPSGFDSRTGKWTLAEFSIDFEWGTRFLEDFGTIDYCPYCGERLED